MNTQVKVSKQSQAISIVQSIMNGGTEFPPRKVLMARFTTELQMTNAGASTYVANLKKLFNNSSNQVESIRIRTTSGSIHTVKTKKSNPTIEQEIQAEVNAVELPVFSKCFCVGDEIVEVACSMNKTEARKLTAKPETIQQYGKLSEVLIEGVPDDITSRKQLKEKFEFIRIR